MKLNQANGFYQTDSHLSSLQKFLWGCFWGAFIGGGWLLADFLRPIIYGG